MSQPNVNNDEAVQAAFGGKAPEVLDAIVSPRRSKSSKKLKRADTSALETMRLAYQSEGQRREAVENKYDELKRKFTLLCRKYQERRARLDALEIEVERLHERQGDESTKSSENEKMLRELEEKLKYETQRNRELEKLLQEKEKALQSFGNEEERDAVDATARDQNLTQALRRAKQRGKEEAMAETMELREYLNDTRLRCEELENQCRMMSAQLRQAHVEYENVSKQAHEDYLERARQLELDLASAQHAANMAEKRRMDMVEEIEIAENARRKAQKARDDALNELDTMQDAVAHAESKLRVAEAEIQGERDRLEHLKTRYDKQLTEAEDEISVLRKRLQEKAEEADEMARVRQRLEKQVLEVEHLAKEKAMSQQEVSHAELTARITKLEADREALMSKLSVVRKELEAANEQLAVVTKKLKSAQRSRDEAKALLSAGDVVTRAAHEEAIKRTIEEEAMRWQRRVNTAESDSQGAVAAWKKEAAKRRKLHNILCEMRGNIRVLARIRPLLDWELKLAQKDPSKADAAVVAVRVDAENDTVIVNTAAAKGSKALYADNMHVFEYDHVYGSEATQDDVYEPVGPFVTSFIDGFNVCIFAYGQTGSGKTFTMEGPRGNEGIYLRAADDIFSGLKNLAHLDNATVELSILEVYNERIRDLLDVESRHLDLRMTPDGNTVIPGLSRRKLSGVDDLRGYLAKAQTARAKGPPAAHNINEHSSRSHLVVTIFADLTYSTGRRTMSKLNLIDLAGSERIGKTQASGERLKEAKYINKSLSALGDVIHTLGNKASKHVPFRNSKLTHVLKDSLEGGAKVAMVLNAAPSAWHAPESLCSLKFGSRCRSVELGAAKKNELERRAKDDDPRVLRRYIAELQRKLAAYMPVDEAGDILNLVDVPPTSPPTPSGGGGGPAVSPYDTIGI